MRVSEGAAVRRGAVLEQEDALPSAELQPSVGDGDAELGLGQRALDVGRHVVRPFVIVAVERDIFRHDASRKSPRSRLTSGDAFVQRSELGILGFRSRRHPSG